MAIYASTKTKSIDPVPAGNHAARLYNIMHLGIIPGEYMGEPKETDTVRLGFELPNETKVFKEGEGERPFVISQEFTLSMGEKANLGKLIRGMLGIAWNPNEETEEMMDITQYMGQTCMLNVIHQISKAGNAYAKIVSAAPIPKGMTVPEAVNEPYIFDFDDNYSEERFKKLPEFLQQKIASSRNYREKILGEEIQTEEVNPDEIPF